MSLDACERALRTTLGATTIPCERALRTTLGATTIPNDLAQMQPTLLKRIRSCDSFTSRSTDGTLPKAEISMEDQWDMAYNILVNNPNLMSNRVLRLALKRCAPVQLIQYMIKLKPDAVSVPEKGPSPLQIALKSSCTSMQNDEFFICLPTLNAHILSLCALFCHSYLGNGAVDVVKALLMVCPTALVDTNAGNYLDPLSYAKLFRPAENELIHLLSLPLDHWTARQRCGCIQESSPLLDYNAPKCKSKNATAGTGMRNLTKLRTDVPDHQTTFMLSLARQNPVRSETQALDPSEINNIKLICLTVLKGHKRLTKNMLDLQKQVNEISASVSAGVVTAARQRIDSRTSTDKVQLHSLSLMKKVQDQQLFSSKTQLVTLDAILR